jgi:hypothetical protein
MPTDYEYRVVVSGGNITGLLKTPDAEEQTFGPAEIVKDEDHRLRLDTIDVLRSWLNRWTALTRMSEHPEYAHLAVRNTFTVLGRHLYEMVFNGAVSQGLRVGRQAARAGSSTLRVLLSFQVDADDLAQLPWELLYAGDEFLANEHRLMLSRNLSVEGRRVKMIPPDPPLVVRFLVTVPNTEAYELQRKELLSALPQSTEYSTSIVSDVLDHWNAEEAGRLLATEPYPQVVHIIGVCRQIREQNQDVMQIYLDDGGEEGPEWRGPQVLVNLFSNNEDLPACDQIRLVVLHLCEPSPLDFEVTFERLAPLLVRKGIPAVLAMQYPLSGKAAGRFVKKLYESLSEALSIEEAVQLARSDLYATFERDRLFGSPVLYMQSVDSQLLRTPTGSPAGADAGPSSVSTVQPPPRSTLDWLVQQLADIDTTAELRLEAEKILRDAGNWPPQLSRAEPRLTRQVRDYAYRPDLAQVFTELVRVTKKQMGSAR